MSLSTSTIESIAASYAAKEAEQLFCSKKAIIQEWINEQKAAITANENIFDKELHLFMIKVEQAALDGVSAIANCPDTTTTPAES
jgi:hypothetical protein